MVFSPPSQPYVTLALVRLEIGFSFQSLQVAALGGLAWQIQDF